MSPVSLSKAFFPTQTTPLIAQLLKAMAGSFPQQLEAGVKQLPEEQQRVLATILQS